MLNEVYRTKLSALLYAPEHVDLPEVRETHAA